MYHKETLKIILLRGAIANSLHHKELFFIFKLAWFMLVNCYIKISEVKMRLTDINLFDTTSTSAKLKDDLFYFVRDFPDYQCESFKINITDQEESYVMEAELPGFSQEDVSIQLNDSRLTIETTKEEKELTSKFLMKERTSKNYKRVFSLPNNVEKDMIAASMENGILTLTIPKSDKSKSHKIEIK